jgi:ketosteroid isomerase-like protein
MRRLALLLALCIGCKEGEPSAPAAAPAPRAAPAPSAAPSPAPRTAERPAPDAAVLALLAAWERAQDDGDYERYAALYGARFTGVRRSGPRTRSFDRAGWLGDRKRMFAKPMQVDFTVTSTSSAGSSVVVLGEQHFKSGSYEDRGPKRLVLTREADGYRLAREEMLASELAQPPSITARFVVQASDGPALVLLARAPSEAPQGTPRSVYPGYTSVVLYDAEPGALPSEARAFEGASSLQVVSAEGVCTARVLGVRRALVVLPHFGTVAGWRGEDPNRPEKSGADEVLRELEQLGPAAFWALELDGACKGAGTRVAVPGATQVAVAKRDEPTGADAAALKKAFAALPALHKVAAEEREAALSALTLVRYRLGAHTLATVATPSECSASIFHATYTLTPAPRLENGAEGGLESVELAADLNGDGEPELVGTSAIGVGELFVTDRAGNSLLTLSLPSLDCPC